ncbi:hypothetical protein NFX46_16600 [Streptomyces phaeoluteigriseus]|uniref:Uncharacterized protein n=1 Tax=Streptomyces phaeoluteigriseus TaxID=114686 RepID=A0ABY4Z8J1_9ACTN|nr:hypothetical protein [Streptomyces phaeoluteigriseus]USQ85261.1 hypothetical protein NFX46_16600 [Streptomyces phaeoluteigriseus]
MFLVAGGVVPPEHRALPAHALVEREAVAVPVVALVVEVQPVPVAPSGHILDGADAGGRQDRHDVGAVDRPLAVVAEPPAVRRRQRAQL